MHAIIIGTLKDIVMKRILYYYNILVLRHVEK